jgi:hypothetical protein
MGWLHRKWAVAFILLFCFSLLMGLEPLPSCNPFLIGTGGLTVLIDDPASASLNPASGSNGFSSSISYPFSMQTLDNYELATIVDHNDSGVIATWQNINNADYLRQDYHIGFRYGNKRFRLGVGYKTLYDEIPGFGSEREEILTTGVRVKLFGSLLEIAKDYCLSSDNTSHIASNTLRLGIGQKMGVKTAIGAGFTSDKNSKTNYTLGGQFDILDNLSALASWSSRPGSFGLGSAFSIGWINLAYAVKTHPDLQWTHSIGLNIKLP